MFSILGWRAWFIDGSILSSKDSKLPVDGCLGFVVYYDELVTPNGPHYRALVMGDWYVVHTDGSVNAYGDRQDGTWDAPPEINNKDILIKSAPTIPDTDWERIRTEMIEAKEWL